MAEQQPNLARLLMGERRLDRPEPNPLIPFNPAPMIVDGAQSLYGSMARLLLGGYVPGRQAPEDAALVGDAFDVAGAAGVGGFASPKPRNALGTFGGRNALTADTAALARAEQMAAQGVPREQIWQDTGWFRGVDGKWRFEIDDSGAMIPFPTQNAVTEQGSATGSVLQAALNHPELLNAYPNLRRHSWGLHRADNPSGDYERRFDSAHNAGHIQVRGPTNSDRLSVLLHETQHGVQKDEGFSLGAGGKTFVQQGGAKLAQEALSWRREMERHKGDWSARDNAVADEYKALNMSDWIPSVEARNVAMDIGGYSTGTLEQLVTLYGLDRRTTPYTPREMYNRTAGEVEARTVQARMNMTPEQRRARPPWLDYDVPEADQIVRGP